MVVDNTSIHFGCHDGCTVMAGLFLMDDQLNIIKISSGYRKGAYNRKIEKKLRKNYNGPLLKLTDWILCNNND